MAENAYTVRALDASTWDAYADLIERNNGVFGGCWCLGFHPEGGEKGVPLDEKRERKRLRVVSGTASAALVFDGEQCVGWCQFGPPQELTRIKSKAVYDRTGGGSPDWRIACCFVGKGHRRAGVATAALRGALDLIADQGGGTVEGYPEAADAVPAGFLFNGALSTYEQRGFTRDRMIGKHRWVMKTTVAAREQGSK
ncbi:MAG: hypothetical protein R2706_18460 [Acidimicrobiales bacterium]